VLWRWRQLPGPHSLTACLPGRQRRLLHLLRQLIAERLARGPVYLSFKAEALWIDFESGDNDRLLRFHGWDDHKKKEVTWEKRKRFDHDDDMVVVRVGLNYKFGYRAPPPYEPLK